MSQFYIQLKKNYTFAKKNVMKALNHFLEPGEEIIGFLKSGGFKNWVLGVTNKKNVILARRTLFFKPKEYEFKVPLKEIKFFDYAYRPFTVEFHIKRGSDKYILVSSGRHMDYDKIIELLNTEHTEAYPSYLNGEQLYMVIPLKGRDGRQTLKVTNGGFYFTELTRMVDENEITCVDRFRYDDLKYFDLFGPWGSSSNFTFFIATPQKDEKYKTPDMGVPEIFVKLEPEKDIERFFSEENVFYDISDSNIKEAAVVFYNPMYSFLRYIHEKYPQTKPPYLEADEVIMLDFEARKSEVSFEASEPGCFMRLTNKRVIELEFDKNQNRFLPVTSWVYENIEKINITRILKNGVLENMKIELLFKDKTKKIFYNSREMLVNVCANMIVSKIINQNES